MESVLQKTMQSLETALRYNPSSVELMASLAEVYVRLGRFDQRTLELCDAVLNKQVDNVMLQQAQSIGLLIEQGRHLEKSLEMGEAPPPREALESAIDTLNEFLTHTHECVDAWLTWTRFQILAGRLEQGLKGLETLQRLGQEHLDEQFYYTLHHTARRDDLNAQQCRHLADMYLAVGISGRAMRLLEKLFDEGKTAVGPTLLESYLSRFSPNRPDEVPEAIRDRFFVLLLDYADHDLTGVWLRKASLLGWEVKSVTRTYACQLVEADLLDDAFVILQRLPIDAEVKGLLNEISERFERREEIDRAVAVLRFINDHELIESSVHQQRENELAREAELSVAELQMKNGRYNEALQRYVAALCLTPEADPALLEVIDEILENTGRVDVDPLLRLSHYFRRQGDHPKALFYMNQCADRFPDNHEVLQELENLFDEILLKNPDLPQMRLELGALYLRTGRHELAVNTLKEAAANPALSSQANRLLARAYAKTGQLHEALDKYRTLRIEEGDFDTLYHLHEELLHKQSNREALMALDLIAKVNLSYRDVAEKVSILEDRVGKLQPDVVVDTKMRELIGDLAVGRYQYLDRLGSGGMGVVHKVFDVRNQAVVAMKILRDSLSGSSKALDRFFREARIAATLHHRNIVNIFDYNISNINGQSYIVMEFVDGPSLREIIDRQFQDSMAITLDYAAEILFYGMQLCDALEAAHRKGIVHRDIKPDNIMINSHGEVKITDFGIVHVEEATFTPTGAMLGTPRYMSPEQVTGGKIDGRSDIYSVGILLYECLLGAPPFMTGDVAYQQVNNTPTAPREINAMVPQGCADMVMRCLAKSPEERYLNAHELKAEVVRQLDNLGGCGKFDSQNCTECGDVVTSLPGVLDEDLDLD